MRHQTSRDCPSWTTGGCACIEIREFTTPPNNIKMMLEGVKWVAAPSQPHRTRGDTPLYATHEGIWDFMGKKIRVYRLNTGQAVIHADDFEKILGLDALDEVHPERER